MELEFEYFIPEDVGSAGVEVEDEDEEEVGELVGQEPVIEGTALGPVEMGTRLSLGQSAALARRRIWLS